MPDPTILAFDTSAAHCAAFLSQMDGPPVARNEDMTRGQAERLMPMLEEVLTEGGTAWDRLDAIAVGVGPGNFTGIRIAVAAARGLAMSLEIPAIGISLFEVRSYAYFEQADSADACLVCLHAPRDQIYIQLRRRFGSDATPRLVSPTLEDLRPEEHDAIAIGEASDRLKGTTKTDGRWNSRTRSTARMASLAKKHLSNGRPITPPSPLYVRPADAAPPREAPPKILP